VKEYQSFEPGVWNDAAPLAVVLTFALKPMNCMPPCKLIELGEKVQLAPGGRLLQLKLTVPLKELGAGGEVAPVTAIK
jgi:hypothetical protein